MCYTVYTINEELICIYIIFCKSKDKGNLNKGYIGVSKNEKTLKNRWNKHRSGKTNQHLKNVYNKYDDIIEYVVTEGTEEYCLWLEVCWRPEKNICWNIAAGGGIPDFSLRKCYKHTEISKEKLRIAHTGKKMPQYQKDKIRDANIGKKKSKEAIQKRSLKRYKSKEYYKTNEITRGDFKKTCKIKDWDINNFEEIFSGKRRPNRPCGKLGEKNIITESFKLSFLQRKKIMADSRNLYKWTPVEGTAEEQLKAINKALEELSHSVRAINATEIPKVYTEPAKYIDGQTIRCVDGYWSPNNGGAGVYVYEEDISDWIKIG